MNKKTKKMAKLPTGYPGATTHADIIQLLHDEVVSLCQKNYGTVSGLEIDGIICISILDTKEQQVVKIHKTLKSVFADTKKKSKRQKTHEQPSYWLGNTGFPPVNKTNGTENFQNDINALSNLLRDTNAAIHKEMERKSGEEGVSKQSKRKRRQPKQRIANNVEPTAESNKKDENIKANLNDTPVHMVQEESSNYDSPGINPFIHKDVIKVKEEKIDPDYEAAEQTQPKIIDVSSVSESDKDKTDLTESVVEKTKVSSLIDRIIDKEIPRERSEDRTVDSQEKENFYKESNDNATESYDGDNSEFQAIEVKVEKNIDESEYGGSQYEAGDFTGASSDNVATGGSNSETENFDYPPEWLYNEHSSLGEIGRAALLDKLNEKGSVALTGYPRERGREERDPQGRSWIEMVKDNVSKYQAALERSSRGRTEVENNTNDDGSTVQTSTLAKSSSSLVALLKKPAAALSQSKEVTSNAILDSARNSRGSSVPIQGTDPISERSLSPSPIVKIEVDEATTHEIYSQSDGEVNGDNIIRNAKSDMSQENIEGMAKAPQGKLESRYPALFSHLQQAKNVGLDSNDQSESLVNRLPFISFQELFSQAATGAPSPRLSESTTMQLLAQARINPYPSKEKNKGQRKVWNWKKRQVRPRDADGKIISPIPVNLKAQKEPTKNRRHFGFHAAVKKTFSKKGQKVDKEQDKDWQPEVENIDIDSDNNENIASAAEIPGTPSRRTRLSCGEKPRINFAEIENSDIEIEDEDFEEDEMYPDVGSEQFIDNVNPLVYTETPGDGGSVFPGGSEQLLAAFSASSEQLNSASSSSLKQYKCSLCGLEFNQEYRWHYHLIKVHGITADKVNLFR